MPESHCKSSRLPRNILVPSGEDKISNSYFWLNMRLFLPTAERLGYLENVYPNVLRVWLSGTSQLSTNNIQVFRPVWMATELGNQETGMKGHLHQAFTWGRVTLKPKQADFYTSFCSSLSVGSWSAVLRPAASTSPGYLLRKKFLGLSPD